MLGFAIALGISPGRVSGENPQPTVRAYTRDEHLVSAQVLLGGKAVASDILRQASVHLEWPPGSPPADPCGPTLGRSVIVVFQRSDLALPQFADALAFTYPFALSNPKIIVQYDRLSVFGPSQIKRTSQVLGHLIAHEITHILERVDHHSGSGLMKAHWTSGDYAEMNHRSLPFDADDLMLIPLGLASWKRDTCPEGELTVSARRRLP